MKTLLWLVLGGGTLWVIAKSLVLFLLVWRWKTNIRRWWWRITRGQTLFYYVAQGKQHVSLESFDRYKLTLERGDTLEVVLYPASVLPKSKVLPIGKVPEAS